MFRRRRRRLRRGGIGPRRGSAAEALRGGGKSRIRQHIDPRVGAHRRPLRRLRDYGSERVNRGPVGLGVRAPHLRPRIYSGRTPLSSSNTRKFLCKHPVTRAERIRSRSCEKGADGKHESSGHICPRNGGTRIFAVAEFSSRWGGSGGVQAPGDCDLHPCDPVVRVSAKGRKHRASRVAAAGVDAAAVVSDAYSVGPRV